MSITNISMYNYMNAAYLAKLTYEISLLSIIQKSLLRKSLTMHIRSRATLRDFDGQEYVYSLILAHTYLCDSVKNVVIHNQSWGRYFKK